MTGQRQSQNTTGEQFEMFFDGDCPLCMREVNFIKRRSGADRVRLTDISSPEFDPSRYGMTRQDFMARIQGRRADGSFVEGVEVFRGVYAAVGFRRLVALSRLPLISHLLELGYRWFAKNRLRLTGRCESDMCSLPPAPASNGAKARASVVTR